MADKPLAMRDRVESILELRGEVERRLMRNKYFFALKKLDEALEAIRPLEAEVIGEEGRDAAPSPTGASLPPRDAALQQLLTAETAAAAQGHWDREAGTPAPEPARVQPESDWVASELPAALEDALVLDERYERPAETSQLGRESSELRSSGDKSEGERSMDMKQVHDYARRLFDAHGDKAESEAAQKAAEFEQQGDEEQARDWRRIQAAIKELRAPHES